MELWQTSSLRPLRLGKERKKERRKNKRQDENVVEHYVAGGSTVNVCLLDLSKAFDKIHSEPEKNVAVYF